MIDIKNPADCCGCTACASICAHDAIKMKPDVRPKGDCPWQADAAA